MNIKATLTLLLITSLLTTLIIFPSFATENTEIKKQSSTKSSIALDGPPCQPFPSCTKYPGVVEIKIEEKIIEPSNANNPESGITDIKK